MFSIKAWCFILRYLWRYVALLVNKVNDVASDAPIHNINIQEVNEVNIQKNDKDNLIPPVALDDKESEDTVVGLIHDCCIN